MPDTTATAEVQPDHVADLRTVYLFAFDSHATDPSEVAHSYDFKIRYARELIGVLTHHGLLIETDVDGEDAWQVLTPGTRDEVPREEAEATIDQWLADHTPALPPPPSPSSNSRPKRDPNPANLPLCKCGCEAPVGRRSNYKPGHDARHAGQVARAIAANPGHFHLRAELLATLPSEALRNKAVDMAERLIAKKEST